MLCVLTDPGIVIRKRNDGSDTMLFSLTWPTFENIIVSLGLQANFLPDGLYCYRLLFKHLSWSLFYIGTGKKKMLASVIIICVCLTENQWVGHHAD
jgi:hypothetical protein